jgi:hypothetical protein
VLRDSFPKTGNIIAYLYNIENNPVEREKPIT